MSLRETSLFLLARFLRIALPFTAAYLITALVFALNGAEDFKLWGLTLLGLATHKQDLLGISWSLDIELQFYLISPLIALFPLPKTPKTALIATALATITGWCLALWFGLWTALAYAPCFAVGMALWHGRVRFTVRQALLSLISFCTAGALALTHPDLRSFLFRHLPDPVHEDWFGMVWVMLLIPALGWVLARPSGRVDRQMGDFSYALYLVHWPVIAIIRPGLLPLDIADRGILLTVIFATALVFFIIIDRPLDRVRRKVITRLMTKHTQARSNGHRISKAKAIGWIGSENGSKLAPFALTDLPQPPPNTRPGPSFGSRKTRRS